MSGLQDIPLAELSDNSLPSTGPDTSTPKSNSLKRFFKLGNKKSSINVEPCEDVSESVLPEGNQEAASSPGGVAKPNTLSRFFTRMKGNQGQDGLEVAAAMSKSTVRFNNETGEETPEVAKDASAPATGKPVPNAKPPTTLKTSISSYWKMLFHRQKINHQSKVNVAETQQQSVHHVDEVHELEMVQQLEVDSPNAAASSKTNPSQEQELTSKILSDGQAEADDSVGGKPRNLN